MKTRSRSWLTALVVLGLAGCESATGPDGSAEVEVAAVGDAGSASSSMSPSYSTTGTGSAEGTVHFRARVYLQTSAGVWQEVTSGAAAAATVSASGSGEAVSFARSRIAARSYTRIRVVFEEVNADVTGGVHVGVGTSLQGSVAVDMQGSGGATVERELEVDVRSGSSSRVIVDLNSDAWLSRADAQTRAVSRADFEAAVRVYSR